jgi:hypothetical protein
VPEEGCSFFEEGVDLMASFSYFHQIGPAIDDLTLAGI